MKKHKIISENLPKGRLIEIYGNNDTGKTFTVLSLISELRNCTCLYVDTDHDLTAQKLTKYGLQERVTVLQPDTAEQAADITEQFLSHGIFDIMVVDSTANLVPEAFKNMPVDQISWKQRSKAISTFVKQLVIMAEQKNITVIFVSQNRSDLDGNLYTTGGKALRFFSSARFCVTEDDITVVKNKTTETLLSLR